MTSSRAPRILLIEDEPGDARLMQLALQKAGLPIEFHCVHDGNEALRFLTRQGTAFPDAPRPDLILLDLKMPGKGGLDTLLAIKLNDALRAIPVVVVTTSTLESDIAAAYRLGAAGYVPKTADLRTFNAAIETLCTYWCKLVRLPEMQN